MKNKMMLLLLLPGAADAAAPFLASSHMSRCRFGSVRTTLLVTRLMLLPTPPFF